ncbi:MAG TPA: hypothetical protein VFM60_07140 [Salinimicrobium sp.]|nr:hypothetical protein [Salinimicrobium sp.]
MDKNQLTYLLEDPSVITPEQTEGLRELTEQYPFFQAARAVRLKGLKNDNSLHYNRELKITAAHTIDRSVLFDFISSEEFNQNELADSIKKQQKSEEPLPSKEGKKDDHSSLNEALREKAREISLQVSPKPDSGTGQSEDKLRKDLGLGAPLTFKREENHSFSEWLKLTKAEPLQREEDSQIPGQHTRKFELIDQFISKSPRIKPGKTAITTNLAEQGSVAPEALMTETLARVYLEQKNYKKAIQAYKILILKNPEKSGFFADQIRAVEKLQEHNS